MSATHTSVKGAAAPQGVPSEGSYAGWYIGLGIVAAVLVAGLGLWMFYHG